MERKHETTIAFLSARINFEQSAKHLSRLRISAPLNFSRRKAAAIDVRQKYKVLAEARENQFRACSHLRMMRDVNRVWLTQADLSILRETEELASNLPEKSTMETLLLRLPTQQAKAALQANVSLRDIKDLRNQLDLNAHPSTLAFIASFNEYEKSIERVLKARRTNPLNFKRRQIAANEAEAAFAAVTIARDAQFRECSDRRMPCFADKVTLSDIDAALLQETEQRSDYLPEDELFSKTFSWQMFANIRKLPSSIKIIHDLKKADIVAQKASLGVLLPAPKYSEKGLMHTNVAKPLVRFLGDRKANVRRNVRNIEKAVGATAWRSYDMIEKVTEVTAQHSSSMAAKLAMRLKVYGRLVRYNRHILRKT